MRTVAGIVAAACAAIGAMPFLIAAGGGAGDLTPPCLTAANGPVGVILETIRTVETGGNYRTTVTTSSASGAYAFINAAWRDLGAQAGVDVDRYPEAHLAPPADQDAVATLYVNQILTDHHGDIAVIPLAWYLPSSIGNSAKMDVVPPIGGNVLTPRQYQTRWLRVYEQKLARHGHPTASIGNSTTTNTGEAPTDTSTTTAPATAGCADGAAGPRGATLPDGRWALPAPRDTMNLELINSPHHDYPAWDFIVAEGTDIYAITGGTVVTEQHWDGNYDRAGCGRAGAPTGCNTCGHGLTIRTDTGLRHTYCHNQRLHVRRGDTVVPGQHIADSGDTGRSGTPHLHLELRINGRHLCPQPLIAALYNATPIPDPASLPASGCSF